MSACPVEYHRAQIAAGSKVCPECERVLGRWACEQCRDTLRLDDETPCPCRPPARTSEDIIVALAASESAREEAIRERDEAGTWAKELDQRLAAFGEQHQALFEAYLKTESALAAAGARIADTERACGMPLETIPATLHAHRNTAQADHEYAERADKERTATLTAIADQPCATEAVRDDGKKCPDFHPGAPGEWCIGCVARAALASTGDAKTKRNEEEGER